MRSGDRLGEYVLSERLGEGGFGEVWKAENPDLPGRFVAVKVAKDPSFVAALRQEARLLYKLDHPNVVRVLTLNTTGDPGYLVLEHVGGESLRELLDRRKKVSAEDAAGLVLDLLAGLAAAHASGLVHRDVKPSNVLLTSDGVPKLADFGLGRAARSASASVEVSAQTSVPVVAGTLDYMSPEQRRGEAGDARSDLYACGVLLYELMAGEPRPVRLPLKEAPARLSEVVQRALSADPASRYQTAAEMSAAIRSSVLLPDVPVSMSPRRFSGVAQQAPSAPNMSPGDSRGMAIVIVVFVLVIGLYLLKSVARESVTSSTPTPTAQNVGSTSRADAPDWSEPVAQPGLAPKPVGEVTVEGIALVGGRLELAVTLRNEGRGALSQAGARLETEDQRINGACLFGRIRAGEHMQRTMAVSIPADARPGPVTGRVRFVDAEGHAARPVEVHFDVKAAE